MKTLLLSASLALLLSAPAGAQWSAVPNPGEFDNIEFFLPGEDALYVGTGSGRVYASTDHGDSWTEVAAGLPDADYAPVFRMVFVGDWLLMSRFSFDEFNYRSHYDGQEWSDWEPLGYQDSEIYSFAAIGETVFAVLTGGVVHRSDDYGTSWTPLDEPGEGGIDKIFAHEGRLFASEQAINSGQFYRSDDLGASWVPASEELNSSYICSQILWQGQLLVCVYHMGGIGTFWSSTDFGDSWVQIQTLPTASNINGMAVADDGRLAIGASGGYPDYQSIWLSHDLVNWSDFTGDLPQASWPFNDLVAQDGWFFKSGGTVTKYCAPQPFETGVDGEHAGAAPVALDAFPNPFNPKTTVRIRLERAGQVDLGVYDLTGRRVATLENGFLNAGEHERSWNGRDARGQALPSGVYLARLSAGPDRESRKLVLLQ